MEIKVKASIDFQSAVSKCIPGDFMRKLRVHAVFCFVLPLYSNTRLPPQRMDSDPTPLETGKNLGSKINLFQSFYPVEILHSAI